MRRTATLLALTPMRRYLSACLLLFILGRVPEGKAQHALPDGKGSGACMAASMSAAEHDALLQAALRRWLPEREIGAERGTPLVQVVYLVPSNRNEHPLYAQSLDASIRHLQEWYHLDMPGGETFTLAEPAVRTLHSTHPEAWYRETPNGDVSLTFWNNVIQDGLALMGNPPTTDRVFLFYADADPGCGQCGGCGGGSTTGGFAVISANDLRGFLGGPWVRQCEGDVETYGFHPCRFVGGMGHELGHAFGLPHPPGCDDGLPTCDGGALMWTGLYSYPNTYLTEDDRAFLAIHPFFSPQTFDDVLPDCDAFVAFDTPYLLEPHDGRYGGPSPWLVWGDLDELLTHTVEVAIDGAFTDVVFTTTTGDEWVQFTDPGAATDYFWRVRRAPSGAWSEVRRFSMDPTVAVETPAAPAALRLDPPAPNPARGQSHVGFTLPEPGPARLALYDALGRRVVLLLDAVTAAGSHDVALDKARLAPGVYVLRLEAGDAVATRRVVVVR